MVTSDSPCPSLLQFVGALPAKTGSRSRPTCQKHHEAPRQDPRQIPQGQGGEAAPRGRIRDCALDVRFETITGRNLVSRLNHYFRHEGVPEYVDIRLIDSSPWNARGHSSNLETLMASVRTSGLLQPIIVRIVKQRFQVVAGNRRLEACKRLHWVRIPCLVKEFTDKGAYEIGLIENIERETLSPLEEARAFKKYVQEAGWGGVSELAAAIGRSKEYVSHRISLLELPRDVLDLISTDKVAPSSVSELIWMKDEKGQRALAKALTEMKLSTSKVREAVRMFRDGVAIDEVVESVAPFYSKIGGAASQEAARNREYSRLLDKAVLVLRICMVRLDSIIEELESGVDASYNLDNLKRILIQKRLLIHNQIGELIQLKNSLRPLDR
jgi:ParB family transcriptional regulator, chromosome partitioning protein